MLAQRVAVSRALVMVAAAVAAGTALVHDQVRGADPIELVTLRSGSYADFRQVFAREAPAGGSVPATLRFPDQPRDRYPAVVVVHTISGFQEANEGGQAAELRRSGFATLTYDSFSARGLSRSAVVGSRAGPPLASGVADAFAALQFLAGHPRIAADRIGIVGFSFGGEVAHLTAFETLRAAMGAGPARFAAHVATYPGGTYGLRAEAGAYTGAPILMLLGEKDDNLPVAKTEDYLAYASAAGHPGPISMVVYPGAFHGGPYPAWAPRASTPSTSPARGSAPSSCWGAERPPCLWTDASGCSTRMRSPRARPRDQATRWVSTRPPAPSPSRTRRRFSSVTCARERGRPATGLTCSSSWPPHPAPPRDGRGRAILGQSS